MKSKLIIAVFACLLIGGSANAQFEDTLGIVDTLALEVAVDSVANTVTVEVYGFTDYPVGGATAGFTWANSSAQLTMTNATASAMFDAAFGIGPFFYEQDDINLTNTNKRFLIGGAVLFTPGIAGDASGRRLWGTYEFDMTWAPMDSVVFDTLSYSAGSAYLLSLSTPSLSIQPEWEGAFSKTFTDVNQVGLLLPDVFALDQNYPNPFNPKTTVFFDIPVRTEVRLSVYNILGQEVDVLADEEMTAGRYEAEWDASRFASGIYFYRLEAGDFTDTKKMVLVR